MCSLPLNDRREETVTRMNTRKRSQIRAAQHRIEILPDKFAGPPKLLQLAPAIDHCEITCVCESRLHHVFILFALQRTGGVEESPARNKQGESRFQDCDLSRL